MPRLSFRTKLLLAMMLVVAGVSLATLLVTQRRVQANYDRMFRSQFQRQIGYFTTLQDARLGAIAEQCLKLSQSVRIIAAMDPADLDLTILYKTANDEFRTLLDDFRDEPRPGQRGSRGPSASFLRFVDAEGKPLSPPDAPQSRPLNPGLKRRLEQKLGFVRDVLNSPQPQQVAYLPLALQTNQAELPRMRPMRARGPAREKMEPGELPTLQEVILTKIVDPVANRTRGALALGFPLPDLVPQIKPVASPAGTTSNQLELIQAGILIEDRLYANPTVISESLGEAVAKIISDRIGAGENQHAEFNAEITGTPYRIFYDRLNENSEFTPAYQVCLYSMAEARREQRSLRWGIASLALGTLAVALLLSLALAHGLSAPIRELVAGTGEVQRGNFVVRVPVRGGDELGQLASAFNEMADGLAQKERYRTVLNMVADEKVAQRMVAGELTLGGELREISVLFCDIRGFTALTQNMPPGEVIEMLNEHMTALVRVVKEHDGLLDKFVGDLLMAIFGAPLSHGQDAVNAARCALRLVEVRDALNQTSRHQLQVGIGIATGTMVAGCMGSADRLNYTVLGERVNLASRLCDRAKAGEILVDENTHSRLEGVLPSTPTGEIQLKGFATPVPAFRLGKVNA